MSNTSVLVLSSHPAIADPVHQQAAAAGVTVLTEPGGAAVSPVALVLAEPGRLAETSRSLARHTAPLHVLAPAPVPDPVYRRALDAGAVSVIAVPDDLPRLAGLLADLDRPAQGLVVAVTGGSGGVGSSVLAAAVALRAAGGTAGPASPGATLLVDLDAGGPGIARLLAGVPTPGITWADLMGLDGRLAASELRTSVPSVPSAPGLGLLTCPDDRHLDLSRAPVGEVVAAAARGHDWVVLDVPRASPDPLAHLGCDLVVVVVDSSVAGVASASRRLERLRQSAQPAAAVVRTRRGAAAGADVARVLEVPLLCELGEDRRLREHLDLGLGPLRGRRSPVSRAADRVLESVLPVHGGSGRAR